MNSIFEDLNRFYVYEFLIFNISYEILCVISPLSNNME